MGRALKCMLGPHLKNVTYDILLRVEVPAEPYLVGRADELVIIIVAGRSATGRNPRTFVGFKQY